MFSRNVSDDRLEALVQEGRLGSPDAILDTPEGALELPTFESGRARQRFRAGVKKASQNEVARLEGKGRKSKRRSRGRKKHGQGKPPHTPAEAGPSTSP